MMALFVLVLIFTWCEILWDWYHEVKLGQSPDYTGSNLLRLLLGSILWITSPFIYKSINVLQYWILPPVMVVTFSFVFDWGLNIMRNYSGLTREYYYLGNKNRLDIWQKEHGGAKRWFYIKLSISIALWLLFYLVKD